MDSTLQTPDKKKRIRVKKYPEGSIQHRKDTNYNKTYYDSHNPIISCELCSTPILARCLTRHKKTERCLKYRVRPEEPAIDII